MYPSRLIVYSKPKPLPVQEEPVVQNPNPNANPLNKTKLILSRHIPSAQELTMNGEGTKQKSQGEEDKTPVSTKSPTEENKKANEEKVKVKEKKNAKEKKNDKKSKKLSALDLVESKKAVSATTGNSSTKDGLNNQAPTSLIVSEKKSGWKLFGKLKNMFDAKGNQKSTSETQNNPALNKDALENANPNAPVRRRRFGEAEPNSDYTSTTNGVLINETREGLVRTAGSDTSILERKKPPKTYGSVQEDYGLLSIERENQDQLYSRGQNAQLPTTTTGQNSYRNPYDLNVKDTDVRGLSNYATQDYPPRSYSRDGELTRNKNAQSDWSDVRGKRAFQAEDLTNNEPRNIGSLTSDYPYNRQDFSEGYNKGMNSYGKVDADSLKDINRYNYR